jgi:demethylmenaquinone methyltransferase/2-methoxy-6-polyprenyl-1,4-benzoquinol methylase
LAKETIGGKPIMSKEYFNSRAAIWDEEVAEKDTSKLEAMVTRLNIKPGSTVLDVGTGTGVFTPFLLKKIGRGGKLVCLDFAEEMLKIAKAKRFHGNISYLCTDIENSNLAENLFDAVVCYSVFPHFKDKPKALREINRLLNKNGRLFICHTSSREAINEIHQSLPEVCDHLLPEKGDVYRMLSEAGFGDICVSEGKDNYLASAREAVG